MGDNLTLKVGEGHRKEADSYQQGVISQGGFQFYLEGRGGQSRMAIFVAKMEKSGENYIRMKRIYNWENNCTPKC